MTIEGLRLKFRNQIYLPLTRSWRIKKLKSKAFTIISNNCWAGTIYESYGIQKQTPTVGLFFMAEDYVEFVSHLKEYVSSELHFVSPEEARAKAYAAHDKRYGTYPIGIIGGGRFATNRNLLFARTQ